MSHQPVVWIYGNAEELAGSRAWVFTLRKQAQVLTLGPSQDPATQVVLPEPDLAPALESCPPELRPAACVNLALEPPRNLEGLPCPVLGWGGGKGPEGQLPVSPNQARQQILEAASHPWRPAWLESVQVNLPLGELLETYRPLVAAYPLNLEIGIDHRALDQLDQDSIAEAAGLLEGRRITAHLPFMDLVPGSEDPTVAAAALRRLEQAADWALALGAVQVVCHLGFHQWLHPDRPAFARRLADNLGPLLERLAERDCALMLENTFEPDPEPLVRCRNLLSPFGEVGYCLDVGHALCFSTTPLKRWWAALAPHLGELHLHDNDGSGDHHLACGQGAVDWELLRRGLDELERRPIFTLEPHREAHLWASLRGLERLWGAP